ncbi:MAG: hypothetical protein IPJ13_25600 [Saprospiraceae bacterium]|nr:hypothetical protein [Saprospiraceae bacterium]
MEVKAGFDQTLAIPDTMLATDDIKHMPALVQKYLHYTGSIDKPKVHNFRIDFAGKIRSYEAKRMDAAHL